MVRIASYDIVFQEIPGEVTLALNLSGCPIRCAGCHSPHLWEETGERLDEALLAGLLVTYGSAITCVCLMGGDADPVEVNRLLAFVRTWKPEQSATPAGRLKTAWYSGRPELSGKVELRNLDYVKLGPYVERLGGLDSPTTNQRLYRVEGEKLTDITASFWK